jgi:hypothetical protein
MSYLLSINIMHCCTVIEHINKQQYFLLDKTEGLMPKKYPFHLITGQGLGYRRSSYRQVGDLINAMSIGAAKVNVFVNASNANLIVRDRELQYIEKNQTVNFHFIYNSQAIEALMICLDQSAPEEIIPIPEDSYFSHHCVARVIDCEKSLVAVGGIKIELPRMIPAWANKNDLIEFNCDRLDVW